MSPNAIVALGTDPVGYHGLRVDISRTCWIGPGTASPRPDMVAAMRHAREHIIKHMALYGPGVPLRDLTVRGHQLEPGYDRQTSACRIHGFGLYDEWAHIDHADTCHEGSLMRRWTRVCFCVSRLW